MQKNQEKKIDELLSHDIIEKYDMPTGWVSLLVSVKKPHGETRVCVNMGIPNTAIRRVHHPYQLCMKPLKN